MQSSQFACMVLSVCKHDEIFG